MKRESKLRQVHIFPFLLISFAIAWGVLGLYIFLPDAMERMFGQLSGSHPLFYLAVYAPAIAAFAVILVRTGLDGLKGFLSRVLLWKTSYGWYLFLIFGMPAIFYGGAFIKGTSVQCPFLSIKVWILPLLLSAIKGPIEEFGWRGFAMPLLQRKFSPLLSALILGIVWGIWHLPAFMLSGTQQSSWAFFPFFLGTIAISIVITALFNQSKGSILLAAIFHFQLMNPIWPDAQPYDTYILLAIAAVLIVVYRRMYFKSEGAVTEVIPE